MCARRAQPVIHKPQPSQYPLLATLRPLISLLPISSAPSRESQNQEASLLRSLHETTETTNPTPPSSTFLAGQPSVYYSFLLLLVPLVLLLLFQQQEPISTKSSKPTQAPPRAYSLLHSPSPLIKPPPIIYPPPSPNPHNPTFFSS